MFTSLFPLTRWSVVARCSSDPGSHQWLIEHYIEGIARYLAMRMPYAERDGILGDITNEVAVRLLEQPELVATADPAPGRRFRYLVMTVAHHLARNAYRRLRRRLAPGTGPTQHFDEALDSADLASTPDPEAASDMDRAWAIGVLSQAWQDLGGLVEDSVLTADAPQILRRHLIDGEGLRPIAADLGLSLTTCQRRYAAGRHHLQRLLRERLGAVSEAPADDADACELLLAALAPAVERR